MATVAETHYQPESVDSRWHVIEQYLPPIVGQRVKEFRKLGCMSVFDIKMMLKDIEEGFHDPVWKFPNFKKCPNMSTVFGKYVDYLCLLLTCQMDVFDDVFPNPSEPEVKVIGEISNIRIRIIVWTGAMMQNDEIRKQRIRDMIKEDEMEDVKGWDWDKLLPPVDLDEDEETVDSLKNKEPVDSKEVEEPVESSEDEEDEETHSESKDEDEDDDDVQIESEYESGYKPHYDPSLGTISAFDLNDVEEDFADPESGEDAIPDYSNDY